MTTTFFEKAFWVTAVSLVSVVRLPMIESGSIVGSRSSLDRQLTRDERRSEGRNQQHDGPDIPGGETAADYSEERLAGYRFGDEYFKDRSDESASELASETAQISGNEADGCERVVKDSMICMLCENPKTHSKYEQCSYVARPHENVQSYASSKSYSGRPAAIGQQQNNQESSSSAEQRGNNDDAGASGAAEESSDERASEYSSDKEDDYYGGGAREYEDRLGESSAYTSPDRRRAAPPKISANKKAGNNKANCREVRKDSMTCTICNDPDNGGNFEKCSYTHQPNDKLYKYSKSKSFGYPGESDEARRETKRVDKIADPAAPAGGSNNPTNDNRQCQRFRKNSSTICNICRDALTGEKIQECEYNLKPAQHAR